MHQLSRLSTQIHFRSNWLTCPVWLSLWETFLQVPTIADDHPKRGLPWDFPGTSPSSAAINTSLVLSQIQGWGRDRTVVPGLLEYLGVSEARWTISNRCGLGEVARPQREPNWTQQPAVSRMAYGLARYNTHVNDRWVKEAG